MWFEFGTVNLGNLTGAPALSLPCGFTPDGMPVGLQLFGRAFDEARVLSFAFGTSRPRSGAAVGRPCLDLALRPRSSLAPFPKERFVGTWMTGEGTVHVVETLRADGTFSGRRTENGIPIAARKRATLALVFHHGEQSHSPLALGAGKVESTGLDYRPSPKQRSTLELLRYLADDRIALVLATLPHCVTNESGAESLSAA